MTLLMYLFIIFVFVCIDYYYIEIRNIEPNKTLMWSIRALVTIFFALFAKFDLVNSVLYSFFLGFLFYSLFDYSLNLSRGKPFFRKGNNFIDRLIPPGIPDLSFKVIALPSSYMIYQYDFFKCLRTGIFEAGFWDNVKACTSLLI